MPTPEETRREIEELRRRADQMERLARVQEFAAAQLRRLANEAEAAGLTETPGDVAPIVREMQRLLSSPADDARLDAMSATANALASKSAPRGRPFESDHPLVKKARELGRSMPVIAAELSKAVGRPIARTTLRGWYTDEEGEKRAIPRDVAAYFEKSPKWKIPPSAWRNGIRD